MARHGYDRGVRFFDMADLYGSHKYVGEAIKPFLVKSHAAHQNLDTRRRLRQNCPVRESLDRYRQEMGTDYIDIVLMHCLMRGGWSNNRNITWMDLRKPNKMGSSKP